MKEKSVYVTIDRDVYLPCFQHLLDENDIDIELIWGGRDSGKSKFLAQLMVERAMKPNYFRCLLIKETHESIRDAQWQMIKDTAEQWNVERFFKFTTGLLGITCIAGGTFHPRGMDNPAKIRSFTNPSDAWVEEGSQISEEAFITLITGLRSDYGPVKLWITFNPEATTPDYKDFWIYKMFFAKYPGQVNFTGTIELKIPTPNGEKLIRLKYRSTHVTYHDNPYVSPQRVAFHESLKDTNFYWYQVFTLGKWGNIENGSPWAYSFNRARHVSNGVTIPHPILNKNEPVYLSWDFNRNPMTCTVIQHYRQKIRVLRTIRIPKSGVDGMCKHILELYPGALFIVTGDYNGNAESSLFAEQVTHYLLIKQYLGLSDNQLQTKPNPRQAKNSTHVNTCLAYYDIVIHGIDAAALVFDLVNVKRRADGTILKLDRDDPAQQADALDTLRYFLNTFLAWFKPDAGNLKGVQVNVLPGPDWEPLQPQWPAAGSMQHYVPDPEGANVIHDAIYAIKNGHQVFCSKYEYYEMVRPALLSHAGEWAEDGLLTQASQAVTEVKRLDNHFTS
jgi:hypothetical protein